MKLIEYRHIPGQTTPLALLATDSSITLPGKPVFLPEFAPRWSIEISVGYIVSRLGKSIPERFAPRYYDSATLIARFVPHDPKICAGSPYSPLLTAFDGALARGIALPAADFYTGKSVKVTLSGAVAAEKSCTLAAPVIDADIHELSGYFILKTGDIIVSGSPIFSFEILPETHVRATFSDSSDALLSFNVK